MDTSEKKLDFSGLVLGFSSAALHYIGHQAVEGRPSKDKNLPLALYNIEILELLQEKTINNLSKEESLLLERVVADLRSKYDQAR